MEKSYAATIFFFTSLPQGQHESLSSKLTFHLRTLQDESSVAALMEACITDDDKLYLCVSSPTIRDKPVQIRPWRLADADFVLDASMPLDPRKTVFVGGVPRPLKAGKPSTTLHQSSAVDFCYRVPSFSSLSGTKAKKDCLCWRGSTYSESW